ncbi:hypothetical protein L210DRAFT_3428846 [Boletus edulis BED1]|uniref:Uncharacterized protein n=1 Tax=Boletus edulis BED1 TaxID=1328754 RepID=A0AAD4G669_BOLED|nr:hypothetical protein L210DRAFT_3428846 [Boletus edulis BED1]
MVARALDALQSTGVLRQSNRMSIEELVNPAIESVNIFDVTDEEIYEAVMEMKKQEEDVENIPKVAEGTENGFSVDTRIVARTRSEALQMASALQGFVGLMNTPYARRLEVALGDFGRETRLLGMREAKETVITDYFPRRSS